MRACRWDALACYTAAVRCRGDGVEPCDRPADVGRARWRAPGNVQPVDWLVAAQHRRARLPSSRRALEPWDRSLPDRRVRVVRALHRHYNRNHVRNNITDYNADKLGHDHRHDQPSARKARVLCRQRGHIHREPASFRLQRSSCADSPAGPRLHHNHRGQRRVQRARPDRRSSVGAWPFDTRRRLPRDQCRAQLDRGKVAARAVKPNGVDQL